MQRRTIFALSVLAALTLGATSAARAQGYPNKVIKLGAFCTRRHH